MERANGKKIYYAIDFRSNAKGQVVELMVPHGIQKPRVRIDVSRVEYFDVRNRTICAHCCDPDDSITFFGQLVVLEEALSGSGFVRCRKNVLVNKAKIVAAAGEKIWMKSGRTVLFSRKMQEGLWNAARRYKNGQTPTGMPVNDGGQIPLR